MAQADPGWGVGGGLSLTSQTQKGKGCQGAPRLMTNSSPEAPLTREEDSATALGGKSRASWSKVRILPPALRMRLARLLTRRAHT